MIVWALVIALSMSVNGKLDTGAQVESVFKTEKECRAVKGMLDLNSEQAAKEGGINPAVQSFGTTCTSITLDIHAKPQQVKES